MEIKISVVIPTYQRPELLHKCLQALSVQDFDPYSFEVVVVSDGEDERTRKKILAWQDQFKTTLKYFALPLRKGPAAARNLGWRKAKGRLIAFTDDDCVPDKHWISAIWKTYDVIYGAPAFVAFTGRVHVPLTSIPTDFELSTAGLESADFVTANCICSRAALIQTEGFDERFERAWREDSDLHFKLIEQKIPIYPIREALVVHPVRAASWGVSIKEQKKTMYNALLFKKNPVLYRKKIQQQPEWNYYIIIAGFLIVLAGFILKSIPLAVTGTLIYIVFTTRFIIRRLSSTSHALPHVLEMVLTSIAIPFVSIFWTLYGAWKYRVVYF